LNTLYGYNPTRDTWIPEDVLRRAAFIPFVGMKEDDLI